MITLSIITQGLGLDSNQVLLTRGLGSAVEYVYSRIVRKFYVEKYDESKEGVFYI